MEETCRILISTVILVYCKQTNLHLYNAIWYAKYFQMHFILLFVLL